MKKYILVFMAIGLAVTLTSCGKKKKGCMDPISINYDADAEESDGTCQYAGTGGNVTIVAKPEHHTVPIIGKVGYVDSAFIKFDAVNKPSSYDLVIAGEEGEDHVHIPNMKPGKYYIMMTGYDSVAMSRVQGGIPVTVFASSGEVNVIVPVSE